MASNHTSHYDLNQWAASDKVLRAEFNADNAKVDAALAGLAGQVAGKASQADLTALTVTVNTKANQSELTALTNTVNTKANQADLTSLTATVNTKANQSDLSNLTSTVNTKASQADLTSLSNLVAQKGNLQVETGSYVGTGTAGSSKETSLGFSSRPLLVIIVGGNCMGIFSGQVEASVTSPISGSNVCSYHWGGNTLSWYERNSLPDIQLNLSNTTYYYLALYAKG